MTSVVDILNFALSEVGYPTPIGSIYEGSRASRLALTFYTQVRDDLFSSKVWEFLRRVVSLGTPVKTAPVGGYVVPAWNPTVNPPLPWQYEYAWPVDCMEIRSVRPVPLVLPEYDVGPNIFVAGVDSVSGLKVVLTNLANAQAIITSRVTDPDEWQDNNFIQALINKCAVAFSKGFRSDLNNILEAEQTAQRSVENADVRRG